MKAAAMWQIGSIDISDHLVVATGIATFFFGFGAGALLNLYLVAVSSPLIAELRGSLNYKSSIFGDGVILPAVNMVAVSFLLAERPFIGGRTGVMVLALAVVLGMAITAYFHIVQAMRGLVNWAMPAPWRWNWLGAWHAAYMFSVATLLSLFYVVFFISLSGHGVRLVGHGVFVTIGIALFFVLLRLDYVAVSLRSLLPRRLPIPW